MTNFNELGFGVASVYMMTGVDVSIIQNYVVKLDNNQSNPLFLCYLINYFAYIIRHGLPSELYHINTPYHIW